MTQGVLRIYERFNTIKDRIDEKEAGLHNWQVTELNLLAEKVEAVLGGCRRKNGRD